MKTIDTALLRELPAVRRAREFHLYDNAGKRYLDLYLNGGRAILGHRPEGFSLIVKNTLARGVYGHYPSHEEGKMFKAARALWGERFPQTAYYREAARPLQALREQGLLAPGEMPADPALGESGAVAWGRPALTEAAEVQVVLPVLPVPGLETGLLVCAVPEGPALPEGDLPSPVVAAGIARCLWNLRGLSEKGPFPQPFEEIGASLPAGWLRRGPYLQWTAPQEAYPALFRRALAGGILLPPDPLCPAVLPGSLTSGDRKILKKFFRGDGPS